MKTASHWHCVYRCTCTLYMYAYWLGGMTCSYFCCEFVASSQYNATKKVVYLRMALSIVATKRLLPVIWLVSCVFQLTREMYIWAVLIRKTMKNKRLLHSLAVLYPYIQCTNLAKFPNVAIPVEHGKLTVHTDGYISWLNWASYEGRLYTCRFAVHTFI